MKQLETVANLEATRKVLSVWDEFKNFAFKGSVVDLAVGVIIGAAFSNIVKSLVDHIIMPLLSLVLPSQAGYERWAWQVGDKTIPYGQFLAALINFLIVALVLYIFIVKFLAWVLRTRKAEGPPPPTKDQELLAEIRDLLKQERAAPDGESSR